MVVYTDPVCLVSKIVSMVVYTDPVCLVSRYWHL